MEINTDLEVRIDHKDDYGFLVDLLVCAVPVRGVCPCRRMHMQRTECSALSLFAIVS